MKVGTCVRVKARIAAESGDRRGSGSWSVGDVECPDVADWDLGIGDCGGGAVVTMALDVSGVLAPVHPNRMLVVWEGQR